jgi:molybdate transport system substrate-binding protein
MLSRISPPLLAFGASVLLLAGLIGALYWDTDAAPPLEVHCAEAMRLPMEAIKQDYEKETGQTVDLLFGPSQTILTNLELRRKGDLFLPADDSYVEIAKNKDLVGEVFNLARMHAVVIVRPGFPKTIATWDNFLAKDNKIGLANVEAAAITKILKRELQGAGLWDSLERHQPSFLGNVNEVGNSVAIVGSNDVGIVWDVVAQPLLASRPDMKIVELPELSTVQARVQIAITTCSKQKDKGARHLKNQGFSDVEEVDAQTKSREELVVYAGAMLRPALEPALIEFEQHHGVLIKRVYNGCGILVGQMKTGATPDVYFACDTRFMEQVQDKFNPATNVSTNQLVITVKKGNPKKVFELIDLATPGLRVGVGHEQQCALGALTKETFIRTGVYAKVIKNVVVQSPTGDMLVNQLRVGSLDVVVAYRSNVMPFADELEGIPITGIPCATPSQPIAVSKNSAHPEMGRLLMAFLRKDESRRRFEKLGFGWDVKEVEKPGK